MMAPAAWRNLDAGRGEFPHQDTGSAAGEKATQVGLEHEQGDARRQKEAPDRVVCCGVGGEEAGGGKSCGEEKRQERSRHLAAKGRAREGSESVAGRLHGALFRAIRQARQERAFVLF